MSQNIKDCESYEFIVFKRHLFKNLPQRTLYFLSLKKTQTTKDRCFKTIVNLVKSDKVDINDYAPQSLYIKSKTPSIFKKSTGRFLRYANDDRPLPKSSSAKRQPRCLSAFMKEVA